VNGFLHIAALRCGYPKRVVLPRVDLEVERGRLLCVIGPNGSGKTTLIRTIASLLHPLGGSLTVGGAQLRDLSPQVRARRVSVVLTSTPSPGYLTVRAMVALGRTPHTGLLGRLGTEDTRAIESALATVGIAELSGRFVTELSDGERQRTAIARAIAQAAEMVVLDEPTAHLDAAGRAIVMTSLQRIAHDTGRLVIATSHDIELVLRTADVVVVIGHHGKVTIGSPEDLALGGVLETLFPKQILVFDSRTGGFRTPPRRGPRVQLGGTGLRRFWTAHALERIGYVIADGEGDLGVVVADDHWEIRREERKWRVDSIEALADSLR
jgi:iron complex transport system ATP-binding protein